MKNQERGFTLIELLVVVLIIGILSAIAIPQYQKAVEKSRSAEVVTMFGNLRKAIDAFCLANPDFEGQVLGCPGNAENKCNLLDIDIESILTCDQNDGYQCRSKNFVYQNSVTCSGYTEIRAYRHQNGDLTKDQQYDIQLDNSGVNGWEISCQNYDYHYPYAQTVCESFDNLL